jgi:hypothetical protein
MMKCLLCEADRSALRTHAHGRSYYQCERCRLTFVDPGQRLEAEAERAHYGTHENDPHDPRYRRFLSRLAEPLLARLNDGAEGLDYGSGPGPALPLMLEERGCRVRIYDPFFAPDRSALNRTYDFVTATEVVEHFYSPRQEFHRLDRLLRPGGWLGVMTEVLDDERDISLWRYARDPTHVVFLSPATLGWLAEHHAWQLVTPQQGVALFRKKITG